MGSMTIGQLAKRAGVNPRTLRYYERIGLLAPARRTEAGYRVYTSAEADRLAFIRRAQATGLSLAEIADIISVREGGAAPCRHVRDLSEAKVAEIDERIAELQALREEPDPPGGAGGRCRARVRSRRVHMSRVRGSAHRHPLTFHLSRRCTLLA